MNSGSKIWLRDTLCQEDVSPHFVASTLTPLTDAGHFQNELERHPHTCSSVLWGDSHYFWCKIGPAGDPFSDGITQNFWSLKGLHVSGRIRNLIRKCQQNSLPAGPNCLRPWELHLASKPSFSWGTQFSSVQLLSRVWLLAAPWTAAHQASLSITNSQSSLKLMSIELVTPSNQLILCCPLLLPHSVFPSLGVFSNESILHIRWPKYWSFNFSIGPSNEYSGLISLRMDWFDLLAAQGTLKSLLQHHSSKASILQSSAFFIVNSHIHTWLLGKP